MLELPSETPADPSLSFQISWYCTLDSLNTNNVFVGEWANKVSHPSSGITKEYIVTTNEPPNKRQLRDIMQGCTVEGTEVKPVTMMMETSDPFVKNKIRMVLAEGKRREVGTTSQHVHAASGFQLPYPTCPLCPPSMRSMLLYSKSFDVRCR